MALEEFGYEDVTETSDDSTDSFERPEWQQKGEHRFVGEGTVNDAPTKEVGDKQAIDIEILDDEELVRQAAEMWTPRQIGEMVEVVRVKFNDGSTWHWPLREWDSDPAKVREHFVEQYVPEIIRWQAKQNGEDPDGAIRESRFYTETSEPDWVDRVTDAGLSEESRKWFNNNAEYLPDLLKQVSSSSDSVDLDTEDTDWTEDW